MRVGCYIREMTAYACSFLDMGHEHQFNFNSGVQESIASACNELEKLMSDPSDKDALSKAEACLDEGSKALLKRQKHIMIADGLDTTEKSLSVGTPLYLTAILTS